MATLTVVKLLDEYGFKTSQDLYFSIAIGEIDLLQAKKVLLRHRRRHRSGSCPNVHENRSTMKRSGPADLTILLLDEKVEGLDYKLAKCCNPVFGDRIFGFVTVLEGIKIHRAYMSQCRFHDIELSLQGIVRARWTRLDALERIPHIS
ncbi:MAG: hypothetical protein MZV63_22640 [Marinilabiliales bacterium]|nr:hypothetical protein [Marinilabiliales bacterium]